MTPTVRAAGAIAAIALAGAILPPAATLVLLAALAAAAWVDARRTRGAPPVTRSVTGVLKLGRAEPLRVAVGGSDADRVLVRQPASAALEVDPQSAAGGLLDTRLTPRERGRHELPGVACATVGPLGLVRRNHPQGPPAELTVYPDLVTAQRLALRLRRGRSAQSGARTRGPLGLGTEFESVREYLPDDDIRQVNWRATARIGRPMSNQYRVERDRDVICVIDCGRLMRAPLDRRTRLDAALDAAVAVALAADELGDRCGVVAFDSELRRHVRPQRRGGRTVIDALVDLRPSGADSDFELAFGRIDRLRRAFVLVLTDLVDEAAARSLLAAAPIAGRRHAVTVAGVLEPRFDAALATPPPDEHAAYAAIAATEVLAATRRAAVALRHTGANVILATPEALAARCVDAYVTAKARARL